MDGVSKMLRDKGREGALMYGFNIRYMYVYIGLWVCICVYMYCTVYTRILS
jgi:hypothetical protein